MTAETPKKHPIRCRIGWHNWLPWEEPKQGTGKSVITEGNVILFLQGRYCRDCRKFQPKSLNPAL